LILLALGLFFNQVNYKTLPGEQVTVSLPDGSLVRLNADSHLKRKRFFWSSDKKVTLVQGEGFFEVEKGDGFQVATKEGSIQVLGTKFNIKNRKDYFEVGCYQGKISFVEAKTNTKTVLTKGQEIIKIEERFSKDSLTNPTPAWMSGESLFRNTPLYIVLREMEVQYGISFEATGVATDQRYTGGFIHGNLETALTTVLAPMGIAYTVGENQKTIRLSAAN
jgi:ferric-dicitrate binding protein FerR (iron transport regulator)